MKKYQNQKDEGDHGSGKGNDTHGDIMVALVVQSYRRKTLKNGS